MAMGRILMSTDITSRSEKAFRDIDASCYDPASKHPTPYPSAHTIAKIVRLARVCSNAGHYEADWNCRIHSYILDLALDNEEYWDELGFLNWYDEILKRPPYTADNYGAK
jgi:hypothetical protein